MKKLFALVTLLSFWGMAWASVGLSNWMKDLPDSSLLTELSIPGTHDSAADYTHCYDNSSCRALLPFVHTQKYDMANQMFYGVRFFDVRLAYEDGTLTFHHGPYYLEQHFSNFCNQAISFLTAHPSEFLVILIKQEHTSVTANTFWERVTEQIGWYDKKWFYLDKKVPYVSDVRGKIVVLSRDETTYPHGYHVEWPDNTRYFEGRDSDLRFVAEDRYDLYKAGFDKSVVTDTKFGDIAANLHLSSLCQGCTDPITDPQTLYFTFLSGEDDIQGFGPSYFARDLNQWTADWLNDHADEYGLGGGRGIAAVDFAYDGTHYGDAIVDALISQNPYPRGLPSNVSWFGEGNQGAGLAIADIDGVGGPEMILLDIWNPSGKNGAHYRVGFNPWGSGDPREWVSHPLEWWWGDSQQGGGIAVKDLNGNGRPDLVVFRIDDPDGENHGYYRIGWDINVYGWVENWSDDVELTGNAAWFGDDNQGAGLAIADLNGNGKPELIVFDIWDPDGANGAHYRIGYDLDSEGKAAWWLGPQPLEWWWGKDQGGGGIDVKDLNGNGRPDLVVFWIDDADGQNQGYYRIGWDMNENGAIGSWSSQVKIPGWFGDSTQGTGVAVEDLDGNGKSEMVIFWLWNPAGENVGYYRILWDEL